MMKNLWLMIKIHGSYKIRCTIQIQMLGSVIKQCFQIKKVNIVKEMDLVESYIGTTIGLIISIINKVIIEDFN